MPTRPVLFRALAFLFCAFALLAPASAAAPVERVVSPGGIEVWLVRERAAPLIAVEFSFAGGSAQDDPGKPGVGNLVGGMLDEGAGPLDSQAFQDLMERLAVQMTFQVSRDYFSGSFKTLSANRDAAFEMLRLALNEPHFEQAAIDRVRQQVLSQLAREQSDPNALATRFLVETAFPGHPYGHQPRGTIESVTALTRDDLVRYRSRVFARDGLRIAIVGDIDPAALGILIDRTFGALPATPAAARLPVADAAIANLGTRLVRELDVPQTVVQFAMPGLRRADPDFIPAFVMNHIFGGGSFTSRLWTEVRETRGLAYSISTGLAPFRHSALLTGSTSTRNDAVAQTLATVDAELVRMAESGPTQEELERAKTFLTGSFLLRFETSTLIAQQLLAIQQDELGIDWIDRRNAVVNAVTLDDVRRVARRLLEQRSIVVLVGRPQGVSEQRPGG